MLYKILWGIIFVCGAAVAFQEQEFRIVNTLSGPVKGYRDPNSDIFIYYGIPYATAPTGLEKFKAPRPAPIWLEPFEAVDRGVVCPQAKFTFIDLSNKKEQENCLIANVYTPDTDAKKLPVVVYVHGGAFQVGFGDFATPKSLVKSKKVIAVTFNYRLGIHGFLCLGTEGAPGNAGMKDQVALLRWVQNNIAKFGGNPEDVTIAGYSAGSASVALLAISEMSKGLFHKVILESGANIGFATIQKPLENAKNHATYLNFTNVHDISALEHFYVTASFETLTLDAFVDRKDTTFVFAPCVERKLGDEVFLSDAPIKILKKGNYPKVPMLYGFANMEGLFRMPLYETWKDEMNEKFSDFLQLELEFKDANVKEEVAKKVKQFYFGEKPVGDDTILGYIDYYSDVIFTYPTLLSAKLHTEYGGNKVYLYEYSFVDESRPPVPFTDNVRGAPHCAQTEAVLDGITVIPGDETEISEEYKKVKAMMREIWLNFIVNGEPVPEGSSLPAWPPMGPDRSPYMELNLQPELRGALLPERTALWDEIYARHYRAPTPPPEALKVARIEL